MSYVAKFNSELSGNARSMQQLAGRKRFNVDIVVTEFPTAWHSTRQSTRNSESRPALGGADPRRHRWPSAAA
jgi:hypothetical protein